MPDHAMPEHAMRNHASSHPADRLIAAIERAGNPLCVGLDPVPERLPRALASIDHARAIEAFCTGVLDAVAPVVPAVKPQSACFERLGSPGVAVLERVVARARSLGLIVVLDAKRGDIGSTAEHYAAAARSIGADWVTVNPYLGASGVEPFLDAALGVFALVRTSNPDSDELQGALLGSGETVAERVAAIVARLGEGRLGERGVSALGAVVGATKSSMDGARLRARMPDQPLLIPGVGAQGATAADVRPLLRARPPAGVVVNASRSVIYASDERADDWASAVRRAAASLASELASACAPPS